MFMKKYTFSTLFLPLVLTTTMTSNFWMVEAIAAPFKPPVDSAPDARVGGGSRGIGSALPLLAVLAPKQIGFTLHAQPSLYWAVSNAANKIVKFTMVYTDWSLGTDPILETEIKAPQNGINVVDLAKHQVNLKPGVEYQWSLSVAMVPGEPSNNIVSSGTIMLVDPPPSSLSEEQKKKIAQVKNQIAAVNVKSQNQIPSIYEEAELWYDALASLSKLIAENPNDDKLRQQRDALLNKVGLDEVTRLNGES